HRRLRGALMTPREGFGDRLVAVAAGVRENEITLADARLHCCDDALVRQLPIFLGAIPAKVIQFLGIKFAEEASTFVFGKNLNDVAVGVLRAFIAVKNDLVATLPEHFEALDDLGSVGAGSVLSVHPDVWK